VRVAKNLKKPIVVVTAIVASLSFSGCAQIIRAQQQAASLANPAESAMVNGINNFRNSRGIPDLGVHAALVNKARMWAAYMANGGCGRGDGGVPKICHSNLTSGINVSWTRLGENVGMVSPRDNVSGMQRAFENSPPHAENMLNREYDFVGVGVAYWSNYMYVAEEFMAT
jgi:uncharacterized protein YkwD